MGNFSIKKLYEYYVDVINDYLIIFISFTTYILFHSFFEKIISQYFVDTFFSYLNSSIINDVVFFLLCLLILIQLIFKFILKKKPSKKSIVISLLLLSIVIYYRYFSEYWSFTSLSLISKIKYVDIITLFLSSNIVLGLIYIYKFQYPSDASKGFYFDNPVQDSGKDLLNRKDLAKSVAQKIINTTNKDSSFAIGISSEWGQGKTSFINFITEHLENDNLERIIVKFNPWLNNDEKSIIYSFFDLLSSKLRIQDKELSLDLEKYSEMLNATTVGGLVKFGKDIFSISNNNDLKQQFNKINNSIKSLGIQIVITIDDLDRLFENEILEVLRLIRNSANFSNTVFIVAYDRNYLITSLKKKNEHRPHFYLEKIFQAEIILPNFEQDVILNKIKETIPLHISETDKEKFTSIIDKINTNYIFDAKKIAYNVLGNLRDVNRFINSFIISYEALKGECELIDLLNIELLRTKYLGVYELLTKEYKNFFTPRDIRYETNYMTLKRIEDVENNKNKTSLLEKHLNKDSNFIKVGLEKDQIEIIISFIHNIFPEEEYYQSFYNDTQLSMVSISHPMGIDRYFHYNLLKTNLSLKDFNDFRTKPHNEFCKKIEDWVNEGLEEELFIRFKETSFFLNKNDFENIIKGVFYFASLDTQKNYTSIFSKIGFDGKNLLQKLDYKNVNSMYEYKKEEYEKFILDIFENQSEPIFVSRLINYILTHNYNIHEKILIDNEKLKNIRKEYFKRHVENAKKIDIIAFDLFSSCYNHQELVKEGEGDDEIIHLEKSKDEEAKEIFKECILKFPDSFLTGMLEPNPLVHARKMYKINGTVTLLWDGWDGFEKFLNTIPQSKEIVEFKEFYQLFRSVNNDFVEFDFKIFIPKTLKKAKQPCPTINYNPPIANSSSIKTITV